MSSVRCLIVFVALLRVPAYCWKFKILGLDEEKIEISRIAVYGARAFLSIPRTYDEQPFTLVEVPWPERSIYTIYSTKSFPNGLSQKIGDCRKVQSAVALDIDYKGRMYVLDKGIEQLCSAKIIIYDLRVNKEILQTELSGVPTEDLNALVIDVNPVTRDVRLIVADAGNNSLLIFNLFKNNWWRLSISFPSKSYKDTFDDERQNLSFNQLAISQVNATLYVTSSEYRELYSISLQELRNIEEPMSLYCNSYDYNSTAISVQYVGDKFGKSKGLYVDVKGNLYYVYERDYAILKWNPSYPFITENMNVVLQNFSQISYPVQIFTEPYYQLWILNSKRNEYSSFIVKIKN